MIRHKEMERITLRIRDGGKDVGMAMVLWNLCMANAEFDTAWVKLDRQQLADLARTKPDVVTRVMKLLHEYGAVFTYKDKRTRKPRYRCNPHVGHAGHRVSELQKQVAALDDGIKQMADELRNRPQLPV